MSKKPAEPDWPKVAAMIEAAVRAGTHSPEVRTVCGGCGEWCDGHYVGRLGRCCAPKPATGPSAELQKLGPSTLVLITPAAPPAKERT